MDWRADNRDLPVIRKYICYGINTLKNKIEIFTPDMVEIDQYFGQTCGLLIQSRWTTRSWPVGHICPNYKESFQVCWDNSIPLFLHAAIYLEVSLFCWTSQNAFSHETAMYKWYCVQSCIAALHTQVDGSMEKKWDTVMPADLTRLCVSGTYMPCWSQKG